MTAPPGERRRIVLALACLGVLGAALVGAVVTAESTAPDVVDAAGDGTAGSDVVDGAGDDTVPGADVQIEPAALQLPDLEGDLGQNELEPTVPVESDRADGGCTIGALSIRPGSEGDGVRCLQQSLTDNGFYTGATTGIFDDATLRSVMAFQTDADLFVDGVVGRESAIELDIWPDEESLVVHTPPPAEGAMDSTGYLLSPVSSTSANAPLLPDGSGSGRRVVYDRGGQRVWAVDGEGNIVRSWLVTGSKFSNEQPGTHTVYSKSEMSTAWNGQAWLPKMIRYQKTEIGNIGFHGIPRHVSDNSAYQTTADLGKRLSGGCQRQHDLDAAFLWAFADVGTTVIVT